MTTANGNHLSDSSCNGSNHLAHRLLNESKAVSNDAASETRNRVSRETSGSNFPPTIKGGATALPSTSAPKSRLWTSLKGKRWADITSDDESSLSFFRSRSKAASRSQTLDARNKDDRVGGPLAATTGGVARWPVSAAATASVPAAFSTLSPSNSNDLGGKKELLTRDKENVASSRWRFASLFRRDPATSPTTPFGKSPLPSNSRSNAAALDSNWRQDVVGNRSLGMSGVASQGEPPLKSLSGMEHQHRRSSSLFVDSGRRDVQPLQNGPEDSRGGACYREEEEDEASMTTRSAGAAGANFLQGSSTQFPQGFVSMMHVMSSDHGNRSPNLIMNRSACRESDGHQELDSRDLTVLEARTGQVATVATTRMGDLVVGPSPKKVISMGLQPRTTLLTKIREHVSYPTGIGDVDGSSVSGEGDGRSVRSGSAKDFRSTEGSRSRATTKAALTSPILSLRDLLAIGRDILSRRIEEEVRTASIQSLLSTHPSKSIRELGASTWPDEESELENSAVSSGSAARSRTFRFSSDTSNEVGLNSFSSFSGLSPFPFYKNSLRRLHFGSATPTNLEHSFHRFRLLSSSSSRAKRLPQPISGTTSAIEAPQTKNEPTAVPLAPFPAPSIKRPRISSTRKFRFGQIDPDGLSASRNRSEGVGRGWNSLSRQGQHHVEKQCIPVSAAPLVASVAKQVDGMTQTHTTIGESVEAQKQHFSESGDRQKASSNIDPPKSVALDSRPQIASTVITSDADVKAQVSRNVISSVPPAPNTILQQATPDTVAKAAKRSQAVPRPLSTVKSDVVFNEDSESAAKTTVQSVNKAQPKDMGAAGNSASSSSRLSKARRSTVKFGDLETIHHHNAPRPTPHQHGPHEGKPWAYLPSFPLPTPMADYRRIGQRSPWPPCHYRGPPYRVENLRGSLERQDSDALPHLLSRGASEASRWDKGQSQRPMTLPISEDVQVFRLRQLAIGKSTKEYVEYLKSVAKEDRAPSDPVTPRADLRVSCGEFLKGATRWRKAVYCRAKTVAAGSK